MVKLMFFGPLKDLMGYGETQITLPASVTTRDGLVAFIAEGNPHVAEELRTEILQMPRNSHFCLP